MKKSILFFCVASLLCVTGIAGALPIQNGSFEDPGASPGAITKPTGDASITGWTVASGTIDYVGPTPPNVENPTAGWTAAQGTSSIDLNGLAIFGAGTLVSQEFVTTPGTSYEVIFALAGNPYGGDQFKDLTVSAAGSSENFTFDTNGKTPTNMGWTDFSFPFVATNNLTTLAFTSLEENTAFGPAIDNVRVNVASGAPVPEPATLMLLGAGLICVALFSRKRFLN